MWGEGMGRPVQKMQPLRSMGCYNPSLKAPNKRAIGPPEMRKCDCSL